MMVDLRCSVTPFAQSMLRRIHEQYLNNTDRWPLSLFSLTVLTARTRNIANYESARTIRTNKSQVDDS